MAGTNKALGQHWLKNREILDAIAELAVGDGSAVNHSGKSKKKPLTCVEIGPGLGYLTSSLLRRFDKVVAVEYDKRLADNLPGSFPGTNLKVVWDDILEYDFRDVKKPFVVAGNIPYYITQPIIGKVLELPPQKRPERVVLLMQKEVAERVLAVHGTTPLALLVENQAVVKAGPVVSRKEFDPAPKVDSQVVVMEMRKTPLWPDESLTLGALLYLAFDHPRKKLLNNFMTAFSREEAASIFDVAGIRSDLRPGDLTFQVYQKLWEAIMEIDLANFARMSRGML